MALVMYLCLSFSGGTMTVDAAGKTEIGSVWKSGGWRYS